jgi:hypothetical protein
LPFTNFRPHFKPPIPPHFFQYIHKKRCLRSFLHRGTRRSGRAAPQRPFFLFYPGGIKITSKTLSRTLFMGWRDELAGLVAQRIFGLKKGSRVKFSKSKLKFNRLIGYWLRS